MVGAAVFLRSIWEVVDCVSVERSELKFLTGGRTLPRARELEIRRRRRSGMLC